MNRTAILCLALTLGACAHAPPASAPAPPASAPAPPASAPAPPAGTPLSYRDMLAALGGKLAVQAVYSQGGVKGWRLYNTDTSGQLTAQGIGQGAMVTHVCGIPVREITSEQADICRGADVSREFELTILERDQPRRVVIRRSAD